MIKLRLCMISLSVPLVLIKPCMKMCKWVCDRKPHLQALTSEHSLQFHFGMYRCSSHWFRHVLSLSQ